MTQAAPVSFDQLIKIKVKPPAQCGDYWRPVHFDKLVKSLFEDGPKRRDWTTITGPTTFVSTDKADLASSAVIGAGLGEPVLFIGVVASNALRRCLRFYVGADDFVFDDLPVGGGGGKRLFTHTIEQDVEQALGWVDKQLPTLPTILRKLRKSKLKELEVEHLLIEAAKYGHMPWSRLKLVEERIRDKKELTKAELLDAFVYVANLNPPLRRMDQKLAFYRMLA